MLKYTENAFEAWALPWTPLREDAPSATHIPLLNLVCPLCSEDEIEKKSKKINPWPAFLQLPTFEPLDNHTE